MYSVVGCSDCDALWVVEGRPETTRCRHCGTRRRFDRLKQFAETDDEDAAREARGRLLAERGGGDADAVTGLDPSDAGVDDEAYLQGSGLDADAVAEAGERALQSGGSKSRREIVAEAIEELDAPDERAVIDYAEARGVPADAARDLLTKLVRAGEATEHRGEYRSV